MFLNYIKDYFLKRSLKNSLHTVKNISSDVPIQTVGLIIDEDYFFDKDILIKALIVNGIAEKNIKIILYRDKIKKNETDSSPVFNIKDFNWKGVIINPALNDFVNSQFDLLISYYDVEKAVLLSVTNNSKALFKAGFSSVDKRLNHLMIDTNAGNCTVFVQELFRYLKILNKI